MSGITTKVVKIPVRILEEDDDVRLLKYKALDEVMRESRYLGNMAIRYGIAFKLEGIPKETDGRTGAPVPLDTRIYRILSRKRRNLDAATVATLSRNFALKILKKSDRDAWEGKTSLPAFSSLFVPFRHQGTLLMAAKGYDPPQFIIEPPYGRQWLSDELIKSLRRDVRVREEQRKLAFVSCFSRKDEGARKVVERIATGEYPMGDSQIKISGKNLTVHLAYKTRQVQPELDPQKVCGVNLGSVIPAVCAVSDGPQRLYIGNGEDIWAAQSKFRAERRRKERRLGGDVAAHRWKKTAKEERWMHTYCHALTRQVILFCLQRGCGRIRVSVPERPRYGQGSAGGRQLIAASSKLHTLLDYKAKEQGIEIEKVDRGNSRYRCSECGHTVAENLSTESLFACVGCGRKTHADYNAARNICMAPVGIAGPGERREVSRDIVGSEGTVHSGTVLRPVPRPGAIHEAVVTACE